MFENGKMMVRLMKSKKPAPTMPNARSADVRIAVLLNDMVLLDLSEFRRCFKRVCGARASCREMPTIRKEHGEFQRLELESEGRSLILSLRSGPLPADFVDVILRVTEASVMGPGMGEGDVDALRNHKAHAVIGCTVSEDLENPQTPVNQAWLIAEAILTLFEHREEFVGYAPLSARMYRPRDWLVSGLKQGQVEQGDLFPLLCNMHLLVGDENWMHTLGMEHFGQPDFEVWFSDKDKARHFFDVLFTASVYSLTQSSLCLGNTLQIGDDSANYRLVESRNVANYQWGAFGGLGLESA